SPLGPATPTAEVYVPSRGAWRHAAPMSVPRSGYAILPLVDGRVLVAGGLDGMAVRYASAEVFNP
ncbi:MAG TPA: kelch repeat-containing protein, partial [Actinomycetota bacterium]|nr:kelch repeat-containing protein [Actinomycetota bacterium]